MPDRRLFFDRLTKLHEDLAGQFIKRVVADTHQLNGDKFDLILFFDVMKQIVRKNGFELDRIRLRTDHLVLVQHDRVRNVL